MIYCGVKHFWSIANVKSAAKYQELMVELERDNNAAAAYLLAVDVALWVTSYLGPTYGHKTSDVVTSMNDTLCEKYKFSILNLL